MKAEKFKVIDSIREIILAIDKEMDNFPKKDIEIKNRIRNDTYDMLSLAYKANSSLDLISGHNLQKTVISREK